MVNLFMLALLESQKQMSFEAKDCFRKNLLSTETNVSISFAYLVLLSSQLCDVSILYNEIFIPKHYFPNIHICFGRRSGITIQER
jgi:hypothetical protein